MKVLYELELTREDPVEVINDAMMDARLPVELESYAVTLIQGVLRQLGPIDSRISRRLNDYALDRLACVDRNILRVAVFEMWELPELPPPVLINEAIEIAKRYSTAESGKFVNGVLGRLLQDSPKANWQPLALEEAVEEPATPEPVIEEEEQVVEADSDEANRLKRFGWTLRSELVPAPESTLPVSTMLGADEVVNGHDDAEDGDGSAEPVRMDLLGDAGGEEPTGYGSDGEHEGDGPVDQPLDEEGHAGGQVDHHA